jgi:hypothetical protein
LPIEPLNKLPLEVSNPNAEKFFLAWLERGDAIGCFENHDLGHPQLGQLLFLPLTPSEQANPLFALGMRAPDTNAAGMGWRYLLVRVSTSIEDFRFVQECPDRFKG